MKTLAVLLSLQSLVLCVLAQNAALSSAVEALPPCALSCLLTATTQSPCELTDLKCTCSNASLQSNVERCVLQSCTPKEGLTTKNITSSLCEVPIRNRSGRLKATNIALAVLSNFSVIVRLVGKITSPGHGLGVDDLCLMVSTYVGMSNAIIIDRGTIPAGLGRDIWTLDFSSITNFVRFFYVMEILYFVELTFLKLSLLFFYKRIFTAKNIAKVLWATIIFNALFGVAFTFAGIFQCQPISHYWTYWEGEGQNGKCFNINALAWANAGISIAVDFWMLAIPLSQIVRLNLATKKKVAVALMFGVGTFVTVVSILRLHSLVDFANSTNPTWDQWDVTHWSIVEINVGIICACMPMFRIFLARVLPRLFGSTIGSSGQQHTRHRIPAFSADRKAGIPIHSDEGTKTRENPTCQARTAISRNETQDDEIELVGLETSRSEKGELVSST